MMPEAAREQSLQNKQTTGRTAVPHCGQNWSVNCTGDRQTSQRIQFSRMTAPEVATAGQ